jgi:hypothetical protein
MITITKFERSHHLVCLKRFFLSFLFFGDYAGVVSTLASPTYLSSGIAVDGATDFLYGYRSVKKVTSSGGVQMDICFKPSSPSCVQDQFH